MKEKIKRIKELIGILNTASYEYYQLDNPSMSDRQYDELYDELVNLETETNIILAGSPTQRVQGFMLDGLEKVEHTKPMLSAAKTKDIDDIKKFIKDNDYYCSYKLDGLTLVVRYEKGKFVQGITRGSGLIGEDVTEQCKHISNLPMLIPNKNTLELRGECVISWEEFDRINSTLTKPYSHPRNLASGTLRNLDLNIVKERDLSFVAFEMVTPSFTWKLDGLKTLDDMGFETVSRCTGEIDKCIEAMQPEFYKYPVDGLIFEINNSELSKQLGSTSHHECCRMALKWEDDLYETKLKDIEWTMGKTGVLTPTAIFDPVEIDGTIVERASLHNISIMKSLELSYGDCITVYKANMIIPQIEDNLDRSLADRCVPPKTCPICGCATKIVKENETEVLMCDNPDCKGKLLGKLSHAVSRNALNIEGLSEATLEKFISLGWVSSIRDIYHLSDYAEKMKTLEGFGKKSVDKLLKSIEESRKTTFNRFICSLSIPLIEKSTSKDMSRYCNDVSQLEMIIALEAEYAFTGIEGFGKEMNLSLRRWWKQHGKEVHDLEHEFEFAPREREESLPNKSLDGKTFVITGSLNHFTNRDEAKERIESLGGKVSGSVSAKTFALVNNDINSNSSKNKKAQELGVQIITEEQLLELL